MTKTDKLVVEKFKMVLERSADLFLENGLSDWKFKMNNSRSNLAETFHSDKTISFSKSFLLVADKEQFEGVTLHEIAHALLGPGFGHGDEFIAKCTEISPNADYAKISTNVPIRRYILTCPSCGISGCHNRKRDYYCVPCEQNGEMVKFDIKVNKIEVEMW